MGLKVVRPDLGLAGAGASTPRLAQGKEGDLLSDDARKADSLRG